MTSDFRFAPPPKRLPGMGGRLAVPIDINLVSAKLIFNAAKQKAVADSHIDFWHGPEHGCPIFDLRQNVNAAWLDNVPIPARDLDFQRFGVRQEETLRVVARELRAGGRHRLHIKHSVDSPPLKASGKGGYLPALNWSEGQVHFNFGFTDLGGGRYLEAWAPANLIYDRFAIALQVSVRDTNIRHTLVTNGEVHELGHNNWRVLFPDTCTALSPMLQLHPFHSVECATDEIVLPVSRRTVKTEAWKFRSSRVELSTQLDHIARWMIRNERSIGPYHHGGRFVAFLHKGGMEYDGACTAAPEALEHEVFHSWWARGLKPATQNDGWIDEAWTVYHDDGGANERRFNFKEPPVRLSPRTPWNRATPIESYGSGARFFAGIAERVGSERLQSIMRECYALHAPGLITTAQLQAHILDRTNDDVIARAFDRWIHGRR